MKKLICSICLLALASCKEVQYVPVETVHTDTLTQYVVQRDSIYVGDSIYVHEYTKGDTVYVDKDRWRTQYRDRVVHDSIYVSKGDSVPVPYEVVRTEYKTPSWVKPFAWIGGIVILSLIIALVLKIKGKAK